MRVVSGVERANQFGLTKIAEQSATRSTPLTYEERQLAKKKVSDGYRLRNKRGVRQDMFGNDPSATGEAILEHAAMYRKDHPEAKLSECVDDWMKKQQAKPLHTEESARFFDEHPATKMNHSYASGLDNNGDAESTGYHGSKYCDEATDSGHSSSSGL